MNNCFLCTQQKVIALCINKYTQTSLVTAKTYKLDSGINVRNAREKSLFHLVANFFYRYLFSFSRLRVKILTPPGLKIIIFSIRNNITLISGILFSFDQIYFQQHSSYVLSCNIIQYKTKCNHMNIFCIIKTCNQ